MSLYFIETAAFTNRLKKLGLEPELRSLQYVLLRNPTAGATDAGTGLRKIRVADPTRGKGKRSGARVHYLYLPEHDVLYLVFAYGKDDQEQLSAAQKKHLQAVVESIKREWI